MMSSVCVPSTMRTRRSAKGSGICSRDFAVCNADYHPTTRPMPTTWSKDGQHIDDAASTSDFLSRLRISASAGADKRVEVAQAVDPEEDLEHAFLSSQAGPSTHADPAAEAGPSSIPACPIVPPTPTLGPRLPPEILLQILLSPELSPTLHPSPLTFSTLHSLLSTSRLCNHCARQQLYSVIILPRRVRDFRRYYDKEREKGWPGIGICKGLFCALDDVSRLTHTSAGWESSFLRTLHILGPTITHLSIWHAESRTLLRDAGQMRGKRRLGASGPAWSWGEGDSSSSDESELETEQPIDTAAQRERMKQTTPLWLQRELASSTSQSEVLKRHRAHFSPYDVVSSSTSTKKDKRKLKGCRPTSLSIVLSLPLFENQEAELFASMLVFSKVQELDVYIPVPAHAERLLRLVGHLHRSPLRRLKVSTTHFSLCMGLEPFSERGERELKRQRNALPQELDLATILTAFLTTSTALHDTLLNEFAGRHIDEGGVPHLERLLLSTALVHGRRQQRNAASTIVSTPRHKGRPTSPTRNGGLASTLQLPPVTLDDESHPPPIRIRIFQRNQAHYGKLKDRLNDFVRRTAGLGGGVWSRCGLWDDDEL